MTEELKPEGQVRMVFEGIEVSSNPFEQDKIIYKAMGKYGEKLAISFARFISNEGWLQMSHDPNQWIKISAPHPSYNIEYVYELFLNK